MRDPRTEKFLIPIIFGTCLLLWPHTVKADVVTLTNGDTFHGHVTNRLGWAITLDTRTWGRLTVPIMVVDHVKQTPRRDKNKTLEQQEAAEEHPGFDFGPYTLLDGWERSLELGLNGSEGNTQTFSFHAGFEGHFDNERKRWNVDAAYDRESEDGDKTRDEAYLEVTRDWLIPKRKYFYYAAGRYDFDEFEDFDHRISGGGGIGYEYVDRDDLQVLGRYGLGGRYEIGGAGGDEFTPEAQIGTQVRWDITDAQKFTFKNTLYPSLGNLGEFRNITKLGYTVKVSQTDNLSVKFGIENEYQSDPGGDAERNDLKYFASLVWDF